MNWHSNLLNGKMPLTGKPFQLFKYSKQFKIPNYSGACFFSQLQNQECFLIREQIVLGQLTVKPVFH